MKKLILASGSPRRRDILSQLGFAFEVRPSHVDEVLPKGLAPVQSAAYLSNLKADACLDWLDEETVILTADTTVLLNDQLINKPSDPAQAREMLRELCGTTQTVITGVTLASLLDGASVRSTFSVSTDVQLYAASDAEIDKYVRAYRPLDKAGAYGIQDWLGWAKATSIVGSYSNVMGLPGAEVFVRLVDLDVPYEVPGLVS